MSKLMILALVALVTVGCSSPPNCNLPDGSPAGFVPGNAPGHQVKPAGVGYTDLWCPAK
jgi:hypothetical protein